MRLKFSEVIIPPVDGVVDAEFFVIADKVYKDILYRHRELFGIQDHSQRDQALFKGVYKEYVKVLKKELIAWTATRKSKLSTIPGAPSNYAKVLDGFPARLDWIFDRGLFNSSEFGMRFSTPPPLLTLLFLTDISTSLTTLKPWLDIALQWIDPYATNANAIAQSGGITFSIENCLQRLEPKKSTQYLLHDVLACIFSYRTVTLVEMRNLDATRDHSPSTIKPKDIEAEGHNWKEESVVVVDILRNWKAAAQAAKHDLANHAPPLTSLPLKDKEVLMKIKDSNILLNALVKTFYPWAKGSTSSSNHRIQSAMSTAMGSLALCFHEIWHYSNLDSFTALRAALNTLLSTGTSKFEGFWDCIEASAELPIPSSSQEPFSTRTRVNLAGRATEIQRKTKKAVSEIIRLLSDKDVGGIPVAVDENHGVPQPHENVYYAAQALFEEVAIASHNAQTIYTEPTRDRRVQPTRRERGFLYKTLDIPSSFCPAPDDQTAMYYTEIDTEELAQIEALGDGSKALQRRMAVAERSRNLKKQQTKPLLLGKDSHIQDDALLKKNSNQTIVAASPLPPSSLPSSPVSVQPTDPVTPEMPSLFTSPPPCSTKQKTLAENNSGSSSRSISFSGSDEE
jgi:hypothetical protein